MAKKAIPSSPFAIYLGQSLLATLHIDAFLQSQRDIRLKLKQNMVVFRFKSLGLKPKKIPGIQVFKSMLKNCLGLKFRQQFAIVDW